MPEAGLESLRMVDEGRSVRRTSQSVIDCARLMPTVPQPQPSSITFRRREVAETEYDRGKC